MVWASAATPTVIRLEMSMRTTFVTVLILTRIASLAISETRTMFTIPRTGTMQMG
jgi:hypothetical protein